MQERRRLLERWRQGGAQALVTLVRVEGSSYRRAGARMLVCGDGEYVGGISGGCLEAEVLRRAVWKVRSGAVVERFSTLFDDTEEMPYGLGCGGTLYLLLEPTDTPEFGALMEAMEASLRGEVREVVTVLPQGGQVLRRTVRDGVGSLVFGQGEYRSAAAEETFREVLAAPQQLVVCGAGNDAQPMVSLAAQLGWSVTVLDAERVVAASSLEGNAVGEGDAVVLMTHSYEQDRMWLAAVLPRGPRYLGLLGARHRSALLLREAATLLRWELERVCERVFAPVGLDLGGDGAEAIALATIAEIQACCQGKLGHSQRMTAAMVGEQIRKNGDAGRYLEAQCAL